MSLSYCNSNYLRIWKVQDNEDKYTRQIFKIQLRSLDLELRPETKNKTHFEKIGFNIK